MGNAASSSKGKDKNVKDTNRAQQLPGLKIAIIGDSGVGKSSLLVRYVHNQFTSIYTPTNKVVIENIVKKLNIPDHALMSLTFWDLPGTEDFDHYKSYFTNLDAAIVVVDLTNPESLKMALVWKQILLNNMTKATYIDEKPGVKRANDIYNKEPVPDKYTIPLLLVGTKLDIVEQQLQSTSTPISEHNNEDKPEIKQLAGEKLQCVQDLEEYGAKYNFTGSVGVSSRAGDGSVHQAIQSFIRHIIEKNYRPRKQAGETTLFGTADNKVPEKIFESCGIEKIDSEFDQAEKCMRRIQSLSKYSEQTIKKFFTKCSQVNLIDNEDVSLENCIISLKKYFCSPDTHLELKEDTFYCTLHVESEKDNFKMASCYEKIFKVFNLEYSASVKAVLKEFPDLKTTLRNIDNRVEVLCQDLPSSELEDIGDCKKSSLIIEKNRAKIKYTQNQASDKITSVENSLQKIKTALLW